MTSITLGYDGQPHVAWLDGRNAGAAAGAHTHGAAPAAGAASDGPRQDLFHATFLKDASGSKEGTVTKAGGLSERPVATNVCFCCKTAIATSGDRVYVAWRHIFPDSVRDIAFARSTDNGATFGAPRRVSEDGWKIQACPDDGPSMAADAHGSVYIAWPTLVPGDMPRKGIFYASLAGEAFTPRLRLDSGQADPSHPQVASDEHGTTAVIWEERAADARRIVLREVAHGVAGAPQAFDVSGTYPVVAASDGHWVALWSAEGANGQRVIEGRRLPFAPTKP